MAFDIKSKFNEQDSLWEVVLAGELDVATAPILRVELENLCQKHKETICIDLKELNYMDSTGLGVIMGAYGKMKEMGKDRGIQLINPRDSIKKLLHITSLDKVFSPEIS